MNQAHLYTIVYFFAIENLIDSEEYIKFLLKALRTQDPSVPEGNQPSRIDDVTVGFIEVVNREQLSGLHEQIKQVFQNVFASFRGFRDTVGGAGVLGMTVYVKDHLDRKIALVVQSRPESAESIAIGYQPDVSIEKPLAPENVTFVSGKDAVNAVLAFFGQFEAATGEVIH